MKKQLTAIVALMVLLPSTAHAAATIRADDSVAGLGTDIDIVSAESSAELSIVVTPPLGAEIVSPIRTDADGNATVQLKGRDTEVAGMYRVSLERNGMDLGSYVTFEILPDNISAIVSSIQLSDSALMPTGADTVEAVVILRDQYGNPLPNRPLKLISSRSGDRINSLQSETDEGGGQSFSLSTKEEGTIYLRAIDLLSGTLIDAEAVVHAGNTATAVGGPRSDTVSGRQLYGQRGSSNLAGNILGRNLYGQALVSFGLIDHFEITAPTELEVNEDATITIVAVDRNGNRVEDYTGLALLSSTDPLAFLPVGGEVQFDPRNLGEKVLTLGLRFRTPNEQILYIEDSTNPDIFGEAFITVTGINGGATGPKKVQISSPTAGTVFSAPEVTIVGTTEPFVNLVVSGGVEEVEGDSDINGGFAVNILLDPNKEEHIIRVKDKDGFGRLDSGEFMLLLDNRPPEIFSASFSPENPVEGTNVLLVTETELNITQITVNITGESIFLDPVMGQPGVYQYLFPAPNAGSYQAIISAADTAGNMGEFPLPLEVQRKGLPKVQNIQAFPETNAVTLQWDPILSDPIDAYRIYVGESPSQFDFSLDTDFITNAAQVAGLRPGTEYFFAVTALESNRESEEFDIVSTMVMGIRLSVTPQDSSLLIDWSNLITDIPLSSFILDFGAEPDNFTEKRILNGELRTYSLRDLINDVTYYLKLTPVDVTGQLIEDLSATADGAPNGDGFAVTPGDEVPFDTTIRTVARTNPTVAPPEVHRSTPQTVSTGLPTMAWWALIGSVAVGLMMHWHRRRKLNTTIAFLQAMESRYKQK